MADWRAPLMSAVCYRDPKAALKFLEAAFGFELSMLIEDDQGNIAHSEMRFGDAVVMVGNEWTEDHRSPASIGGKNTQTVHIQIDTDVDAHCERARAAGAKIGREPADQPYGDRVYTCVDPEGHSWSFSQPAKVMTAEDMAAATGRHIETKETGNG